ncbi:prolyl oligopeptidase family serine peptidase [Niveibacterium microcysteis]|uniref:Prolyl oligopeptidase family serine peptidase n=1 Tax=Niveibacterium microcysteis TaxID=2811415 RepID=A0ABX7M2N7_9RHOO|nr:prolyl oligopeptidase family serine peptidase [Niveibacterium microcysteis]QSI76020.1 prolyl oligopeptidase family serine peptidase [Niveibacterium microcysteis]
MSDMRGRLWPMVVYLHGSSPDGSPKTMEQLRGDGINYYIEHGGQDFPAIVVSPLEASYFHDEAFVDAVIRDAQAKYAVDRSRVSLAGFSLGGLGAYPVALAFPHRFSAVLAAGGGFTDDLFFGPQAITEYGNGLRHLQNTPFHVVHGDADMNVPVAVADNAVKALRNAEVTVTYDRMPGVDHLGSTNYAFNAESLGALIKQRGERLDDETNHIHHADRLVGRYEFASTSGSPQVLHLSVDTQGRLVVENETFATTTAYYPIGDDRYVSNSMFYRVVRNADGRMSCMYWIGTFWGAPIYTDAEHAATCGYGPQN